MSSDLPSDSSLTGPHRTMKSFKSLFHHAWKVVVEGQRRMRSEAWDAGFYTIPMFVQDKHARPSGSCLLKSANRRNLSASAPNIRGYKTRRSMPYHLRRSFSFHHIAWDALKGLGVIAPSGSGRLGAADDNLDGSFELRLIKRCHV